MAAMRDRFITASIQFFGYASRGRIATSDVLCRQVDIRS
jgi:hypothetical protein